VTEQNNKKAWFIMFNNTKFLIVRLSSIGDVLHATPVARTLKENYPNCHITWIVSQTAAELLKHNPDIDELFIWSREEFEKAAINLNISKVIQSWQTLKKFFKQHHFDIVLDIHGLFMSGIITRLSQSKRRIGMSGTRELNRFFMTELAPAIDNPHMIKRYLSVLQQLGIETTDYHLTLPLPNQFDTFAKDFFARYKINSQKKTLMINPRTSWPNKNWGNQHFASCIDLLDPEIQLIISGGPSDKKDVAEIIALTNKPIINIAGKMSLIEMAALLKNIDLLLTGDTGALHIATAVMTPTISLWGPTRPEQYGPLVKGHTFICSDNECRNCNKTKCRYKTNACMNRIEPATVAKKIHMLLTL